MTTPLMMGGVPVELPEPDTEDSLSGMMETRPIPSAAYARLPD